MFQPIEEPIVEESIVEMENIEEQIVEESIVEESIIEMENIEEPIVEESIVEEPIIEESTINNQIMEQINGEEQVIEYQVNLVNNSIAKVKDYIKLLNFEIPEIIEKVENFSQDALQKVAYVIFESKSEKMEEVLENLIKDFLYDLDGFKYQDIIAVSKIVEGTPELVENIPLPAPELVENIPLPAPELVENIPLPESEENMVIVYEKYIQESETKENYLKEMAADEKYLEEVEAEAEEKHLHEQKQKVLEEAAQEKEILLKEMEEEEKYIREVEAEEKYFGEEKGLVEAAQEKEILLKEMEEEEKYIQEDEAEEKYIQQQIEKRNHLEEMEEDEKYLEEVIVQEKYFDELDKQMGCDADKQMGCDADKKIVESGEKSDDPEFDAYIKEMETQYLESTTNQPKVDGESYANMEEEVLLKLKKAIILQLSEDTNKDSREIVSEESDNQSNGESISGESDSQIEDESINDSIDDQSDGEPSDESINNESINNESINDESINGQSDDDQSDGELSDESIDDVSMGEESIDEELEGELSNRSDGDQSDGGASTQSRKRKLSCSNLDVLSFTNCKYGKVSRTIPNFTVEIFKQLYTQIFGNDISNPLFEYVCDNDIKSLNVVDILQYFGTFLKELTPLKDLGMVCLPYGKTISNNIVQSAYFSIKENVSNFTSPLSLILSILEIIFYTQTDNPETSCGYFYLPNNFINYYQNQNDEDSNEMEAIVAFIDLMCVKLNIGVINFFDSKIKSPAKEDFLKNSIFMPEYAYYKDTKTIVNNLVLLKKGGRYYKNKQNKITINNLFIDLEEKLMVL